MDSSNPDRSVDFFYSIFMRYKNDSEGVTKNLDPLGAPMGPPKSPKSQKFFKKSVFKRGVQSTGNDLISLDPKPWNKFFFSKNFENLGVETPKNVNENFFRKMVFKKGVKSTGNDLICLDPKPWNTISFSKNFENFRVETPKNGNENFFFEKRSSKGGCNQ